MSKTTFECGMRSQKQQTEACRYQTLPETYPWSTSPSSPGQQDGMAITQAKKSASDKEFIEPKKFSLKDAIDPVKVPKIKGP
jgi:hypothetical protein